MTNKDFQEKYKVNLENNGKSNINQIDSNDLSNVDRSYNEQKNLRDNGEYERKANEAFIKILGLFSKKYKGVGMDCPIGRIKSDKSLKEKIGNLEIKRLCTIFEIDNLNNKEKDSLYKLLIGKSDKSLHKKIYRIFNEKIENLKLLDSIMKEKDLNNDVKMALLRITRTRLGKEESDEIKKSEFINDIEDNYGEEAAKRTGKLANNIMHWENIKSVKDAYERIKTHHEKDGDKELIEKLYDSERYLKLKDLIGFRMVLVSIPDELETDNPKLRAILDSRKSMPDVLTSTYNDLSCIEVEKDFADFVEDNEELLKEMDLKLIARKSKAKQNGYIADHLKFCTLEDEKETPYTFEIQLRSVYRDDMARGTGPAGHENKPGKKRNELNINSPIEFAKQTSYEIPRYIKFQNNDGKYEATKCSMMENILVFYFNSLDVNSRAFKKAMEYSKDKRVIDYWESNNKEKSEER